MNGNAVKVDKPSDGGFNGFDLKNAREDLDTKGSCQETDEICGILETHRAALDEIERLLVESETLTQRHNHIINKQAKRIEELEAKNADIIKAWNSWRNSTEEEDQKKLIKAAILELKADGLL